MAESKIILCDTDILVEFYRMNQGIIRNLKEIRQNNIAVSIITVGELIQSARNKKELNQTLTMP